VYITLQQGTIRIGLPREALSIYYFTEADGDLKSRLEVVGHRRGGKFARRVSASAVARELILERLEQLEPSVLAPEDEKAAHA